MGGQTTYNAEMQIGSEGLRADSGFGNVLSPRAAENIKIGLGVVKVKDADYQVRLPQQNAGTLVFSADLVTSNITNGKVNGTSVQTVIYTTSHLVTMGLIATAIAAADGILSATVGGANNRTITVVGDQSIVAIILSDFLVTAGSSQATIAITNTTSDTLYGVALRIQNKMNLYSPAGSDGASPYYTGDCVSMLTKGRVLVKVEADVTSNSPVYVRFYPRNSNVQLGAFRGDSDSGTCFLVEGAIFRTGALATKLATLEINFPT